MSSKNSIAKIEPSAYPVLNPDEVTNVMEIIETNLGTAGVQISQLDKVTVPPGGGKTFAVNPGDGEIAVQNITGIIVWAPTQNGFWSKPIEEAPNDPPACFSADGITGIGDPGGQCYCCPNKEWGSDFKERGKACRDLRPIFLLQPGEYLPIIVQTSRMSIKRLGAYFTLLARKGIPYYAAITEIGLEQQQRPGTPLYSVLTFAVKEVVPKEQRAALKQYQDALKLHTTAPIAPTTAPIIAEEFDPFEDDASSLNE